MGVQDKTVKITIAVDDAAAAKAKRAIAEITAEVSRLVEMTSKMGGLFGGGGGGGMGIRVGSVAGQPGTNAATQIQHKGGGGANAMVTGLTQAATGSAQVFRGAAEGSKSAFKAMQDGLKNLADAGDREVRRLERAFGRLNFGKANPLQSAVNQIKLDSLRDAGIAESGRLGGGKGGGGGFFGGTLNKMQDAAKSGSVMDMARALLPAGGLIAGAAAVANFGLHSYNANRVANIGYGINEPMFGSTVAAQTGQIYGGNALALRHGDIARGIAMKQIMSEDNTAKIVSDKNKDLRAEQRRLATPVTLREHVRTEGLFGGAKAYVGSRLGANIADLTEGKIGSALFDPESAVGRLFGMKHAENVERTDIIARKTAEAGQAADQAAQFQQRIQNKMASDPMFMERMNNFYQGSLGAQGLARGAGISGSFGTNWNTGQRFDTVAEFQKRSLSMGRTDAERVAARQKLGATAGRGFFYGGDSILGPEAGGLHNAAQIIGVGAQFGGRGSFAGGTGFLKGIQGQIGRGGVDITAGSQIADLAMSGMTSGSFQGTTGAGLASTLMEAGFAGTTGGDMRAARMMGGGIAATNQMMSGSIDPLQNAMNFSAAMKVAGNLPWATKAALTRLDTASALDIVRTGKVPLGLQVQGVTADMVRKYVAAQDQTAFARVSSKMLTDEQNVAVAAYRRGGLKGALGGLKGAARERTMHALSSAISLGTGDTPESAYMRVRIQAAREGLLQRPHGRGAGDPVSSRSARRAATKDEGAEVGKIGEENADDEGDIRGGIKFRSKAERASEAARRKAQAGGDATTMSGAIDQVAQSLQNFVSVLRGDGPGRRAGPPTNSASR